VAERTDLGPLADGRVGGHRVRQQDGVFFDDDIGEHTADIDAGAGSNDARTSQMHVRAQRGARLHLAFRVEIERVQIGNADATASQLLRHASPAC